VIDPEALVIIALLAAADTLRPLMAMAENAQTRNLTLPGCLQHDQNHRLDIVAVEVRRMSGPALRQEPVVAGTAVDHAISNA
jgi:hypothetical protein